MKKICLFRLSALGDCLHVLPLIESIKKKGGYAITWIIARSLVSLFENIKGVRFIVIDKPKNPLNYFNFYRLMKKESFDILLCLQSNLRANLMYPFIKAKRKIGYKRLRAREGHSFFTTEKVQEDKNHLLDHYFCFLDAIGVRQKQRAYLPIAKEVTILSQELVPDGLFVVIHPFASKPVRNWSKDRYKSLIQELIISGVRVVITGIKGQEEQWNYEVLKMRGVINLIGRIDLCLLAALIKRAKLVIAPDTGPLHLADILATPLIGLYAASNPEASGPYYQRKNVINKFPEALNKFFPKKKNPPLNFKIYKEGVMDLISYHEVLNTPVLREVID